MMYLQRCWRLWTLLNLDTGCSSWTRMGPKTCKRENYFMRNFCSRSGQLYCYSCISKGLTPILTTVLAMATPRYTDVIATQKCWLGSQLTDPGNNSNPTIEVGAHLDFLQNLCKFWWIHPIFTNFGDIFVEIFVDSLKFSLILVIDFSPILPLFFSQYMFTNFGDFFLDFFCES